MSRTNVVTQDPAAVFAALGSAARLELLTRLGDGDARSITELTEDLDLTRQAVTKHLHVLRDAGIVAGQSVGRETRFRIRPDSVAEASDYLAAISRQWDSAIERLRAAVEE